MWKERRTLEAIASQSGGYGEKHDWLDYYFCAGRCVFVVDYGTDAQGHDMLGLTFETVLVMARAGKEGEGGGVRCYLLE